MMKKIIGFIFIVVSVIFAAGSILQIPGIIASVVMGFSGSSYAFGSMIGTLIFYGILLTIIYFLIKYGVKWLREPSKIRGTENVLDEDLFN